MCHVIIIILFPRWNYNFTINTLNCNLQQIYSCSSEISWILLQYVYDISLFSFSLAKQHTTKNKNKMLTLTTRHYEKLHRSLELMWFTMFWSFTQFIVRVHTATLFFPFFKYRSIDGIWLFCSLHFSNSLPSNELMSFFRQRKHFPNDVATM